jgi:hypothetical protein
MSLLKMKIHGAIVTCIALIETFGYSHAQQSDNDKLNSVKKLDSTFWQHYNSCNTEAMREFFTDDLEFYHDKGGPMKGLDNFLATAKKNLCSNDNFRLKREAVAGTVELFPMHNGETLYGAVLTGQHVFYIIENGNETRLDGLARFSHLWLMTANGWKMSRVLSYDHGPATDMNKRKEIVLEEKELKRFEGDYQAKNTGLLKVKPSKGMLQLIIGDKLYELYPESKNLFFVRDRDLTFEFLEDRLIVRERGKIVEEATVVKK